MDCVETGLPQTTAQIQNPPSGSQMDLARNQGRRVFYGKGGYAKAPSKIHSMKPLHTALTQSWSATFPGLALPKCSHDNYHFVSRPDLSSFLTDPIWY